MLMKIVALFLTPALVACAQNPQADEHVRAPGQDEVMEAFGGGLHQKVALSSDGKWILAPDSLSTHVHLWELETGKKKVDFKGCQARLRTTRSDCGTEPQAKRLDALKDTPVR
jgi:hypothetical protein